MLHLSTKGSKKSYTAKSACLTAGLVAVFASSSVFAVAMRCLYTGSTPPPGAAANHFAVARTFDGNAFTFTDLSTNTLVKPEMIGSCTIGNNIPVNLTRQGQAIEVRDAATGQLITGIDAFYLSVP